ncbi:hypothetical protein QQ020_03840 [Fulvivirgaceae bacterium BMA12]|uniref:Uncharacterized protein n=1 Tax=Agaribacillus aureus TaxID=3051825 RepID=A0ABT8L3X8_9BACT|nr:hypothetical protein [Fulvivirgaceae bacterium BMA12]
MENKTQYLEDISQIRSMMERSSRFISLSGLSGVFAGVYALAGAFLAHQIINNEIGINYQSKFLNLSSGRLEQLVIIALAVLGLAIGTGIILTTQKARKRGLKIWDKTAKLLTINLLIPLITGGILCLIFLHHGLVGVIAPSTLIFYGLSLINASKYTFTDIRYLGFAEIALGLISAYYVGFGLYFWALGFGILHILYGAIMYFKYER